MKGLCAVFFTLASVGLAHAQDTKVEWTTDLSKMKIPDAPVSGSVMGAKFKVDVVTHEVTGALTLKMGTDIFGDAKVLIFLGINKTDELAGKKFEVETKGDVGKRPHVHMNRRFNANELPKGMAYVEGYALKLEFGDKKDGKIPAKIYLCMPDDAKTVIAGTFAVEVK